LFCQFYHVSLEIKFEHLLLIRLMYSIFLITFHLYLIYQIRLHLLNLILFISIMILLKLLHLTYQYFLIVSFLSQ